MVKAIEKKSASKWNMVLTVLLIAAIVAAILLSYTAYMTQTGGGVPSIFGMRFFSIQSDSMLETFARGDLVAGRVVRDSAGLEVGDIITFWTVINGVRTLNTHRIMEISDNITFISFVTKGDNNPIEDQLVVHQNEIVGKFLFSIPKMGTFIDFLQTEMGFLLVIVVPAIIFFLYNLISFFKALFAYQAEKVRLQILNDQTGQSGDEKQL